MKQNNPGLVCHGLKFNRRAEFEPQGSGLELEPCTVDALEFQGCAGWESRAESEGSWILLSSYPFNVVLDLIC